MSPKFTIGWAAGLLLAVVAVSGCTQKKEAAIDNGPVADAPVLKPLTLAAVEVSDKCDIQSIHIKTIQVSEAEYNRRVMEALDEQPDRRVRELVMGTQAIGRTTRKPITADKLIFEDQLEPSLKPMGPRDLAVQLLGAQA